VRSNCYDIAEACELVSVHELRLKTLIFTRQPVDEIILAECSERTERKEKF